MQKHKVKPIKFVTERQIGSSTANKIKWRIIAFLQALLAVVHQPRIKCVWRHLRSDAWFEMVMAAYNENQWYENFRVTKTTFMFTLDEIRVDITRQDTVMSNAISAERRLALSLYYLASTAEFRTIAHLQCIWCFKFLCLHLC